MPPRTFSDPHFENWQFEPDDVDVDDDVGDAENRWSRLFFILKELGKSPVHLKSLTIGANKWSVPTGDSHLPGKSSTELAPMHLSSLMKDSPERLPCLEKIEALSLPIHTGLADFSLDLNVEDEDALATLDQYINECPLPLVLKAASSTLRYLDLGSVDLMRPAGEDFDAFDLALNPPGHNVLRMMLFSINFPALKHIKLSGWVIQPMEFLKFLDQMQSTLEFLELHRNITHGDLTTKKSSMSLAKAGGRQMSLQGVIIDNYELIATSKAGNDDMPNWDINDLYDQGYYQYAQVGRDYERESMWLEGRKNMLF